MQKIVALLGLVLVFGGCIQTPDWVEPVSDFDAKRYMGRWYEVARLDHRFERGLNSVAADYSMDAKGKVTIKNNGYMVKRQEWRYSEGQASFVDGPDKGLLKVSYMWPFYAPYVVFKVDDDYEHAYVCGADRTTLWLLAREPTVYQEIIDDFEAEARKLGFDISQVKYIQHL